MMGNMKKLVVFLLVCCMTMAVFAGCSAKPGDQPSDNPSETQGTESPQGTEGTPEAAEAPTPTPEWSKEPITFSIFIDHPWYLMDSFGGRPVDDLIIEKTGVTLDVTRSADDGQLPVLIASGDLHELVYTANKFESMAHAELCYSYDELIEKYCPEFPVTQLEKDINKSPDGKFYAIRNGYTPPEWKEKYSYALKSKVRSLIMRKDIMEELGNPPLNDLEDLYNILVMVRDRYPDMVPLLLDRYNLFVFFGVRFGVNSGYYCNAYLDENNTLISEFYHPGYKKTYAYLNRLVREKLVPKEALITSNEQFHQLVMNGRAFAFIRNTETYPQTKLTFEELNPGKSLMLVTDLLSENPVWVWDQAGYSGMFVTKECKDPARAIQFLYWFRTEEGRIATDWGIEGVHWEYGEDGLPRRTIEASEKMQTINQFFKETGIEQWNFFSIDVMRDAVNVSRDDPDVVEYLTRYDRIVKDIPTLFFTRPDSGTDERAVFQELNQLAGKYESKMINSASDEEFEKNFNDMLAEAEKIGLKKILEFQNERWKQINGTN